MLRKGQRQEQRGERGKNKRKGRILEKKEAIFL